MTCVNKHESMDTDASSRICGEMPKPVAEVIGCTVAADKLVPAEFAETQRGKLY